MLRLKRYENMICHSHFTCFLLGQLGKCSLSIAVGYPQALFWRGLQFHHFFPERLQNCCLWACGHLGQSLKPLQACKFDSQVKEKRKEKQTNARGKPAHASGTCWMHISKGLKSYVCFTYVSYCFVGFRFVSVNRTWTELLRAGTVFFSQSYSISNAPASIQEARFRSPSLGIHQHSKSWNHARSPTYASCQKGWWCVVTNCACTMYIVHVPFSSDQQCVSFKCVELVRMRSLAMESAKMI